MNTTTNVSPVWLAALAALDDGRYAEAVEIIDADTPDDDPAHRLWRAEVFSYLGRYDEMRVDLDAVRATAGVDKDLAARCLILHAEEAACAGRFEEVDPTGEKIGALGEITVPSLEVRRGMLAVRVALRQGRWDDAIAAAAAMRRFTELAGTEYDLGKLSYLKAYAYFRVGDYRQTGRLFSEAIPLLERSETENGRWLGFARCLESVYLADLGRHDEALERADSAEAIGARLGITHDMLSARNNAVRVLIAKGMLEEAVERLRDVLRWEAIENHHRAKMASLYLLALALGLRGEIDEALEAARSLVALARACENDDELEGGQMLVQFVRLKQDYLSGLRNLEALRRRALDGRRTDRAVEASLYMALGLAERAPDVAREIVSSLERDEPAAVSSATFSAIVRAVRHIVDKHPIQITPTEFVVRLSKEHAVDYDAAKDCLRRFLVYGAIRQFGGKKTPAAKLLKMARTRIYAVMRSLCGLPERGGIEKGADERPTYGLRQDDPPDRVEVDEAPE
jgi:tetratricopeptide (TPR) repeat protein